MTDLSRRALLLGIGGGLGGIAVGSYGWNQYSTRNAVQFRPLEAENQSDTPATITITVTSPDGYERTEEQTLAAAGDEGASKHFNGPWLKSAREYALTIAFDGNTTTITTGDIQSQLLDEGDWGSDCASVSIFITEQRTLDVDISNSGVCGD